jgi:hypothetical protein
MKSLSWTRQNQANSNASSGKIIDGPGMHLAVLFKCFVISGKAPLIGMREALRCDIRTRILRQFCNKSVAMEQGQVVLNGAQEGCLAHYGLT